MAKRKVTPKAPPQSVDDVLLHECVQRITPDMIERYAVFVFRRTAGKQPGKRQAQATLEAIMNFANLGWTYYHGKRHQEFHDG